MFEQRHFEAIAKAMQRLDPADNPMGAHVQWNRTISEFCVLFQQHNVRFDTERFIRACQPGANVRARKA